MKTNLVKVIFLESMVLLTASSNALAVSSVLLKPTHTSPTQTMFADEPPTPTQTTFAVRPPIPVFQFNQTNTVTNSALIAVYSPVQMREIEEALVAFRANKIDDPFTGLSINTTLEENKTVTNSEGKETTLQHNRSTTETDIKKEADKKRQAILDKIIPVILSKPYMAKQQLSRFLEILESERGGIPVKASFVNLGDIDYHNGSALKLNEALLAARAKTSSDAVYDIWKSNQTHGETRYKPMDTNGSLYYGNSNFVTQIHHSAENKFVANPEDHILHVMPDILVSKTKPQLEEDGRLHFTLIFQSSSVAAAFKAQMIRKKPNNINDTDYESLTKGQWRDLEVGEFSLSDKDSNLRIEDEYKRNGFSLFRVSIRNSHDTIALRHSYTTKHDGKTYPSNEYVKLDWIPTVGITGEGSPPSSAIAGEQKKSEGPALEVSAGDSAGGGAAQGF